MEKMDVQSPNFGGPNPEGLTNGLPGGGMTNGPYLNGPSQPSFATILSGVLENQKPPGWQLDLMMEKLRQKSNQLKPLTETAKNIRTALTERRYFMDQTDRVYLQKNLDSLQQSIKVNSLQSMVERLEMVSRQLGLKFTSGGNGEWFISSDMFYLELLIDPSGTVQEVKIQHDGKTEQQNVPEMVDCLRRNDFGDFTAHLEGLVAIYQLNADKKIKSKAFIALQALEADLLSMASTYAHINDGEAVVMKSLLGLLQPRKGGHPVKLVYFVSPYEFLDTDTKMTLNTDAHTIIEKKLGSVANICIQASTSRKLQMSTTVSLMRTPDCKTTPRYGTLNATNSTALPACFTINLGKPIPICKELLMAIQTITGIHCFDFSDPQPILGLITRHVSNGTLDCSNNRGLFVALPDTPDTLQVHCYFMTETASLEGITVSSINFTLASQLPPVIALLRQQVIFNTLVGSCVRVGCKPEMDCTVFEVNALSYQNISVSFQHPLEDSLVTLEFDLRDVSHPSCRLHVVKPMVDIIPTLEEHACKVVQRSLSIPVTVRAVIRRWQTMKSKYEPSPEYSVPVGGSYGSESFNASNSEMSCGTESEKHQGQQQQHNPQHSMVPGMVMGLNGGPNPSALSNFGNTNSPSISAISQHHSNSTPGMHYGSTHSGRHPSGSSNSSYTISPVSNSNTGQSNSNFQSPATTPTSATSSADLMSSFMNPMFFTNQMNMGSNMQGNFPNMGGMTLQNFLEAKQNITGMLDQGGQRGRRRKRKGTSSDSNMNTGTSPSGGMTIQGNPSVTRPSPSPSPKSPRTFGNSKSPKRRPSEGSDISDTSQGENTRAPTPQTPLTPRGDSNAALSLLMNEIGMDVPDPRWNIDITPVGGPLGSSNQGSNSSSGMDNFIASKLLSNLGSSITSTSNMGSSVGSEFSIENVDLDMEIEPSDGLSSGFMGSKFSMPMSKKPGAKKSRDFPKRSISLDSHSSGNLDDIGANLQSLINSATNSGAGGMDAATSVSSLVTPSLSITPVTTNSSMGQTTVNSLLAAIRPGIEIIPLPNPVQIPNSITVTPIQPKPLQSMADSSKKGTTSLIGKDKAKGDETTVSTIDGNGTTIKKKLSSSSLPGDSSSKKERKRKASSVVPPLLDEDGMIVQDYNPIKQPKLSGPFSSSNASLFSSLGEKKNSGGQGSSISVSLKGGPSPSFGMGMKKPGSPGLARAPTPNKSQSPTPKIGGKPSVSTLKSVSGSPKYSEMSIQSSMKSKNNKERKNSSGFQGNPKIAKNLSLVGGPPGLPNLVPNLKSLSDGSNLPLSLATLNPSLLGLSNTNAGNLKTAEASMAEALMKASLLSKSVMDSNKLQQQNQNQLSSQVIPNNATSNPGQRTPGGNNNSANVAAANNNNNNSIAAAAAAAGGFGAKKGLLAVIDKLKSQQHTPEEIAKKDAGKMDYLKVSSSITSDVMQFKKNQNAGANPGNVGSTGPGGNNGGNNQGGNGGSGFSGNNQEYMVKPGGQGLKMKLGITSKSSNSLKDKTKAGMKLLSNAKKGFSGPKSQQGSISSSQSSSSSSSTSKSTTSSTGFSTSSTPNKKSSSSSSSGSKSAEKDQNSADKSIKSQKSSSSSTSANVTSSSGSKGRPEEDKDLTRKLFMPGSGVFDAPKFDITKYQIPKKSSSGTPSGGSGTGQNQGGNNENSPKNSKASSPQSSKSSDRDVITPTKDVEKLSSSLSSSKALFTSSSSEGKELQFKDKDVVSLMQTATNSELPPGSSSSSSVLLSTSIMESKSSYSSSGNPSTPSEPTKIKLSSSSISEMPFLQEMNKLFANSPMSASMGSPMNLSGPTSIQGSSNKYPRESSSGSSEADSSTDNNGKTFGDSKSLGSTRETDRNSVSGQGAKDFASPESPDPMNNIQDDAIYKNTLTIPTTPLQTSQPIIIDDQPSTATLDTSLDDDDQLVMDVQDKNSKGSSSGNTPEKSTKTSSASLNPPDDSGPKNSKENFVMPPPPVPDSSSTPSSSTSGGGNSQTSVNSPIMSTASVPSPTPIASVKSPAPAATVPIVSVHIVHSPQPNSPALLRSPLVVQSPHSSHASPYAIDDDLMDEALIGTGK